MAATVVMELPGRCPLCEPETADGDSEGFEPVTQDSLKFSSSDVAESRCQTSQTVIGDEDGEEGQQEDVGEALGDGGCKACRELGLSPPPSPHHHPTDSPRRCPSPPPGTTRSGLPSSHSVPHMVLTSSMVTIALLGGVGGSHPPGGGAGGGGGGEDEFDPVARPSTLPRQRHPRHSVKPARTDQRKSVACASMGDLMAGGSKGDLSSRRGKGDGHTSSRRWRRHLLPPGAPSAGKKHVFKDVMSYLFGCGSKRAIQMQIKDELAEVTQEMDTMEISEGVHNLGIDSEKQNPKSNLLSIGKKKFNMDSKKGLEYLNDHGLLKNHTPEDIAEFLYNGEGLSKRAIGDYLGERDDFNIAVLKAFVNLHEFSDMLIVQALRQFLWSFRLPGEAQKIDRMMECFAQRYCELNPQHFSSTDTCYVLSFAIIMLNTSLHNPSVKDKPGVDRFIDMNRGINDGKDLPAELLTRVFDNIKKEPFKIPEDDGDDLMHTFFNPDKEGWLWKQGGRYKSWKRRWFLLKDHCLYYFEFTQDKEPKGIIPLMNIQVREISDRDKPHCFELYSASSDFIKACKTNSEGKVVEGKHTVYRMSASSATEKEEWMKCIKSSIKSDTPFYSILQARRKKAQQE